MNVAFNLVINLVVSVIKDEKSGGSYSRHPTASDSLKRMMFRHSNYSVSRVQF